MKVNFEEKTYETYFNSELAKHTKIFYPPGQVCEGDLGFDFALYTKKKYVWKRLGFSNSYQGAELKDIEVYMSVAISQVPKIKTNLLLQYKKPEFLQLNNSSEWTDWNQPYFRYEIYPKQQELLEKIHQKFYKGVLILYASPALEDVDKLYQSYCKGNIITDSNLVEAIKLKGHKKVTYTKGGNFYQAHSEPEIIEKFNLISFLDSTTMEFDNSNTDNLTYNKQIIIGLGNIIKMVMLETQSEYYSKTFELMIDELKKYEGYELLYNIILINEFVTLLGFKWFFVENL
jgi:hypothetical protein